ncbi:MAG: VCBS repeat-containing protein, partial [Phycisphaerales bacterium]|nr:VCBS repeat-containing protein [Phycisphaerales bacterium]
MVEHRKNELESLEQRVLLSGEVEQVTIGVGDAPSTVVVADFNGDGLHDFAVSDGGDSVIRFVFGDPSSSTGFSEPTFVDGGTTPTDLHAFDVDGDGDEDLTFFDESSGMLGLWVNDGSGSMTWGGSYDYGVDAVFARAEPLTTSGHHDHVVAFDSTIEVRLFTGSAGASGSLPFDGTLPDVSATYDLDGTFSAMEFHDVDFDEDLDLVVTMSSPNQVVVMLNDGSGAFTSSVAFDVGTDPAMPIVSDINGDEMPDFIVANTGDDTATIIASQTSGGWAIQDTIDVGDGPITVFPIGFHDGPDIFDLFSVNRVGGDLSIFSPDTTGVFALDTTYDIGDGAGRPWVGDFDGNGFGDVVIPATDSDQVVFLYNVLGEYFPGGGDDGGHDGGGSGGGVSGGVWHDDEEILPFDLGFTPDELVHGDFDHDGFMDLLVSVEGSAEIMFLWGTGEETVFEPSALIATPFVADWLGVLPGDVDEPFEVALFNESSGRLVTLVEGASGPETHMDVTLPTGVTDVWLEPVTSAEPGVFDLLVLFGSSSQAMIFAGEDFATSGDSLPTGADLPVGPETFDLSFFDWDGDGRVDVLSQHVDGMSVSLNQGDGTFSRALPLDLGSTPEEVLFGDFDDDGETDMAWLDGESRTLQILMDIDASQDGTFDIVPIQFDTTPTHLLSGLGGAGTPPPLTVFSSETGEVWDVRMHPSERFAAFAVGTIDPSFDEMVVAPFAGSDVLDVVLTYPATHGLDLIIDPWIGGTGGGGDEPVIGIFDLDDVPDILLPHDVNGDGLTDLVAGFFDRAEVVFLFATNGEDVFEAQTPVQTPFIPEWIGVLPSHEGVELVLFDADTSRVLTMAPGASEAYVPTDFSFANSVE